MKKTSQPTTRAGRQATHGARRTRARSKGADPKRFGERYAALRKQFMREGVVRSDVGLEVLAESLAAAVLSRDEITRRIAAGIDTGEESKALPQLLSRILMLSARLGIDAPRGDSDLPRGYSAAEFTPAQLARITDDFLDAAERERLAAQFREENRSKGGKAHDQEDTGDDDDSDEA